MTNMYKLLLSQCTTITKVEGRETSQMAKYHCEARQSMTWNQLPEIGLLLLLLWIHVTCGIQENKLRYICDDGIVQRDLERLGVGEFLDWKGDITNGKENFRWDWRYRTLKWLQIHSFSLSLSLPPLFFSPSLPSQLTGQ